jgi:hypothetical protein
MSHIIQAMRLMITCTHRETPEGKGDVAANTAPGLDLASLRGRLPALDALPLPDGSSRPA